MSWGDNRQRRREMIFLEAALCRHTAFSHSSIPISRFCILMLTTFDPFGFASAFGLRLNCFLGEGNKQTCNQAIIYITRVVASGVVDNVTNDIYALPFHAPNDPCASMQEFHTSAEEMRHNLLAIYQKLGKSFDVGDIAARFS